MRKRSAPSVAAYRGAVRAFRARYPWVRAFEAFNEPNHSTQPTYRRPELAAGYWRALRADCRRCTVAAGGLTGSAPAPAAGLRATGARCTRARGRGPFTTTPMSTAARPRRCAPFWPPPAAVSCG